MDKDKRENEIYELREQGLTYSHIASLFDISRSRAHQIFRIAKYKQDSLETLPPLKRKLSKRTQKALVKHFGSESILEEPQKIALLGSLQILRINFDSRLIRVFLKQYQFEKSPIMCMPH